MKSISTVSNLIIATEKNTNYLIEIRTYLGTTVFKDIIEPKKNRIEIKGLDPGKYIVHISNKTKSVQQQININSINN